MKGTKKIKNNPGIGGKKIKITFPKCFPSGRIVIKGGHIPPLPPCCARRACLSGLLTQNASLSTHGTTTPKNLVSQIAFGKRFANLWFVFAKLKFSISKQDRNIKFLTKFKRFANCFFWGGRAVSGAFTHDGRNTPRPPLKRGRLTPPPAPSRWEGKRQKQGQGHIEKNLLKTS